MPDAGLNQVVPGSLIAKMTPEETLKEGVS